MSVNTPVTIWRDTQGLHEFSNGSQDFIDDSSSNFLVDPGGTFIVDTGVLTTLIPATTWSSDDGK